MLEFDHVSVGYRDLTVVHDVSFHVDAGEVVSLVGSNGAGKSTILRTVAGLLHPARGEIRLGGEPIHRTAPYDIVKKRVSMVPEARQLFGRLSVWDNLLLGAYTLRSEAEIEESLESALSLFPILKDRREQRAETLSGGEQQQLAIARGLMSRPSLLMLDESMAGLTPGELVEIIALLREVRKRGVTLVVVEHVMEAVMKLSDRVIVLNSGRKILEGTPREVVVHPEVVQAYLGERFRA